MEEKGRAEKSGKFSRRLGVRKHTYTTHTCMSCGVGVIRVTAFYGELRKKTRKYYFCWKHVLNGAKTTVLCNLQVANAYLRSPA